MTTSPIAIPTMEDLDARMATLTPVDRNAVQTWHDNALWYAWGRLDAGDASTDEDTSRIGWDFAVYVAVATIGYLRGRGELPGIMTLWSDFRAAA